MINTSQALPKLLDGDEAEAPQDGRPLGSVTGQDGCGTGRIAGIDVLLQNLWRPRL